MSRGIHATKLAQYLSRREADPAPISPTASVPCLPLSRPCLEHLLADIILPLDAHAHALVEPGRAGKALRVDAQRDSALPAAVERAESVTQQRLAQTSPAPGPPHRQIVDPAAIRQRLAEQHPSYLVASHSQEPERGIEGVNLDVCAGEVFVGLLGVSPVVPERLTRGGVGGTQIGVGGG